MKNEQEGQQNPEGGKGEIEKGEQQTLYELKNQVIYQPVEQYRYREIYRIMPTEQNTNQFKDVKYYDKFEGCIPMNQESKISQQQIQYITEVKQYPSEERKDFFQNDYNFDLEPRDSKRKNYESWNNKTNNGGVEYKAISIESIPKKVSFEVIENKPQVIQNLNNRRMVEVVETKNEYRQIGNRVMRGKHTIGGSGVNTGLYKFEGERVELREQAPQQEILIEEEEINKEILRRRNKEHQGKRRYELVDKYYAVTEADPKALRKRIREEEGKQHRIYTNKQGLQEMKANLGLKSSSDVYISSYKNSLRNNSNVLPANNFCRYLLEQINRIRENPSSFISDIQNAKANIIKDKHDRIIYKNNKLRIALAEGEFVFDEAINFLNNCPSMEPLIYSPTITVEPPKNLIEIKDRIDMSRKVELMVNNGIPIKAFWRDIIKDPKISFLLMIIDDSGSKRGLRRQDILDPDMRYIGISSTEINGNFVCYLTFSPIL